MQICSPELANVSDKAALPHERLDAAMAARADELGMGWVDIADEAGIRVETLRSLRRGNNQPSRTTKRKLDRALGWKLGSIDAVLAGGDPTPLQEPARQEAVPAERNDTGPELTALARELIEQGERLIEQGERLLGRGRGGEQKTG